jgi:eukaryotic-like serine/threonine-protein kinase
MISRMPDPCPTCGSALPPGVLSGHCPRCLLSVTFGEPVNEPAPTRVFGDFELIEELGRGGMGVVYRARQISLDRLVALKLIPLGEFARPAVLRRFRQEAMAVAALRHPNIVAVYQAGENGGQPYLAMELIEGNDLAAQVRERPLPAIKAATYLSAVARAVAFAHEHGILHRDLKPSNILIDPFDQPRITDFGLAKRLDLDAQLTLTGESLGSPAYVPPEQARGDSARVGPWSDVYSLGSILYHLLSGRPPFQADSVHGVLLQVESVEPLPLRRLIPSVPIDLETIALKCLEKNPARRYPTAGELAADLDRFLRHEPIHAQPVGLAGRALRWCRRRPAVATLSGGLALALVIGVAGVLWQYRRAEMAHVIAATTRAQTRIHEYSNDLRAASDAVERGLLVDARRLLSRRQPLPGEIDQRGFEWRYLWHRSESQQMATLRRHTTTVCGVAISSDGRWAASTGMDGRLCLWNLETQALEREWPLNGVGWFVNFSADGRSIFSSFASTNAAVWSLADGQLVRELSGARGSLAVSAPFLAGLSVNPLMESRAATIQIWNHATGESVRELPEPGRVAALSPDGRWIAVGLARSNILLRELASDRVIATLETPVEAFSLAFAPDGSRLAMAGGDKSIRVWNLPGSQSMAPVEAESTPPGVSTLPRTSPTRAGSVLEEGHWLKTWAVAFSPDGRRLASTSSDRSLRIWDTETMRPLETMSGHADEVWCVAWGPDGQSLITGGKDGWVLLWRLRPTPNQLALPNRPWNRPVISNDGRLTLTHLVQDAVAGPALWSTDGRRLDAWPTGHTFAGLTSDGLGLELDTANARLALWTADHNAPVSTHVLDGFSPGDTPAAYGSGLTPDGRFFFALRTNGLARVWNATTGQLAWEFPTRPLPLACARLSTDARWLAISPESPYEAYLYDTRTGAERVLSGHTEYVKRLAFSPDSSLLATAGIDGRIKLWETATGTDIRTLAGHWQNVDDVSFSPDGRTLASIESRTCLKLWRLDTFLEVTSIAMPDAGETLVFSPAGDRLAVVRTDGRVTFLDAGPVP